MSNYWEELNKYDESSSNTNSFGLIPHGTIAQVRMTIKPGGYNDQARGWTDTYATKSKSESIYLEAEFIVLEGQYVKRKIWSKIGLHSPKGPDYENMGKAFIKSIINSAHGLSAKDTSEKAIALRNINSFKTLDGIEFIARIEIAKDRDGNERNEIRTAITPDHKDYTGIIGKAFVSNNYHQISVHSHSSNINNNRPNWV